MTTRAAVLPNPKEDPKGYARAIIATIPTGAAYNEIAATIQALATYFPADLAKVDPEDITRWVAEIDAGTRTDRSIRNDILNFFVGEKKLQDRFGIDAQTARDVIAGKKRIADLQPPPGNQILVEGATLIRVRNPAGSDAPEEYYLVYEWEGVQTAYRVGDRARLNEIFGSPDVFDSVQTVTQAQYDARDYVDLGSIDQELGGTESIASRRERETRAIGMEDLPDWIAGDVQAKALIVEASAQGWSPGRLYNELEKTQGFRQRYGAVIARYKQQNVTTAQAVAAIEADEAGLRNALRPYLADQATSTPILHDLLTRGWTPTAAASVLEAAETLTRDPDGLARTNYILAAAGLPELDDVGYLNALRGHGPQDVIETINTATAARALDESGIDLDDADLDLIMELVDTSDRLLTADSWRQLSQQLAFNMILNKGELTAGKLGIEEDDLIAAAFGRESPTGKSSGEVLGLLARFERDRQAASEGFEGASSYIDDRGRLRIQGLGAV
jgi:hypothetical protein